MMISMKRQRVLLAVTTSLLAVGILAAPAQAHNANHSIKVAGSMFVTDYDPGSANEQYYSQFSGSTAVGPNLLYNTYTRWACADEVRGVLRVEATHLSGTSTVAVKVKMYLYEGTSCSTTDLDGYQSYSFNLPLGGQWSKSFTVWNTAEGDPDNIQVSLVIKNT